MEPGREPSAYSRNSKVRVEEALAGQTRATAFSPSYPIFVSLETQSHGIGGLTASDVLAGERLDGKARFAWVSVHADTHSIALVLAINVKGREGGMSMSRCRKQCQHCKEEVSIHFVDQRNE
jgi:hypothetical protein